MKEPIHLPSKKAQNPDLLQKWQDHQLQQQLETPKRLEEVAKFLSGMISISLTIFLIGDDQLFQEANTLWVKIAAGLWLLSLMITLAVQFPRRYHYVKDSVASLQNMHGKIVRYKYRALVVATILFVLALGILVILLIF